jgi:hypothetical protein
MERLEHLEQPVNLQLLIHMEHLSHFKQSMDVVHLG